MNYKHLIITLSALAICSNIDPRHYSGIDARLMPYVLSFEYNTGRMVDRTMSINIKKIDYKEMEPDASTEGACMTWSIVGNVFKEILIVPEYYELYKNDPVHMELVMWHELGHCTLNIEGHRNTHEMKNEEICDTKDGELGCDGGTPTSIMRWDTFSDYEIKRFYLPDRDKYIKELISK